jgi:DNA-binding transcriptional MerR regulator
VRPIDLGREVGISAQQVRNYESLGIVPPAVRSTSGRRLYENRHLAAIRTARVLMAGYGWQTAQLIMRAAHRGDREALLASVDGAHAALDRRRREVDIALGALEELEAADAPAAGRPRGLRSAEAAAAVGARTSALRFWERQGLLRPSRQPDNGYRVYDREQMRRLRIVAVLRQLGYRAPEIGRVLDELGRGRRERALEALLERRRSLIEASSACLRASAELHAYLAGLGEAS